MKQKNFSVPSLGNSSTQVAAGDRETGTTIFITSGFLFMLLLLLELLPPGGPVKKRNVLRPKKEEMRRKAGQKDEC